MALEDVANERANIAAAPCEELVHRVRAKHPITFTLRFGEELVRGAFVRECFAPLEVLIDVATNGTVVARLFQRVDLAPGINAHFTEVDRDSKIDANFAHRLPPSLRTSVYKARGNPSNLLA